MTHPPSPPSNRTSADPGAGVRFGPLVGHRDDEPMRAFRRYGVGQFIHWGLYSMLGNEWQGRSARGHAPASEWIRQWDPATAPEGWPAAYDALADQFDPQEFDARRWARTAREMGARYVIFTTKHHDGFALWPSEHSTSTIASSPYPGDIVGEIVEAYTAEGIDVFLYYSVLEWNHPDYVAQVPADAEEQARWDRFLRYTRAQLIELLERYPQVKGLWFDGTWDPSWSASYEFTYALEQELRALRPGLVIGSRFRSDEHGSRHVDSDGALLGDYEQRWERKLPASREQLDGHDWDCVMTIPPNGWGHIRDTTGMYLKTSSDMIDLLLRCRAMGGNLVINVGPDGQGRLTDRELEIAREVGAWVSQHAEAIYEAGAVDAPQPQVGHLLGTDERWYLAVQRVPVSGVERLALPAGSTRVPCRAWRHDTGEPLELHPVDPGYDLDPFTYCDLEIPPAGDSPWPFVIVLELEETGGERDQVAQAMT